MQQNKYRVESHLNCVRHSVQELNDKQWRYFSLDDRQEEELAPVNADEIVVWGLQDRGHILRVHCLLLGLKKVITDTPADDTLPVFLQEDVPRVINQEQTVDHLSCNNKVVVVVRYALSYQEKETKSEVFKPLSRRKTKARQMLSTVTCCQHLPTVNLSKLTSTSAGNYNGWLAIRLPTSDILSVAS